MSAHTKDPRVRKVGPWTYVTLEERWCFEACGEPPVWNVFDLQSEDVDVRVNVRPFATLDEAVAATIGEPS